VELSLSSTVLDSFADEEEQLESALELSQEEWSEMIPMLTAKAIFAFPLNPLKELVHNLNHFDEMNKKAKEAEASYQKLTPSDRYFLNANKSEIQAQIDSVLKLSGESNGCFGGCLP
jgi:hypothetical protein